MTSVETRKIFPSLLAANWLRLGEELQNLEKAKVDGIHIDIMDGHYVPNLSFGPHLVEVIRQESSLFLDVHLMVNPVELFLDSFLKAKPHALSFHPETTHHPHRIIAKIQDHGCLAGIVLNPGTSVHTVEPLLDEVDFILIMTVNPGFGGQSFLEKPLQKARELLRLRPHLSIAVDGGITPSNASLCWESGIQTLITGSSFFKDKNYKKTLDLLKSGAD